MNLLSKTSLVVATLFIFEASQPSLLQARGEEHGGGHAQGHGGDFHGHGGNFHGNAGNFHGHGGDFHGNAGNFHGHGGEWNGGHNWHGGEWNGGGVGVDVMGVPDSSNCWVDENGNTQCDLD